MIEKICARLEEEIVSAKKTMKTIVDNGGHTGDYSFANGRKVAYKEAIDIVQEVAKEYGVCEVMRSNCEVAKDGGWIPCSERLPEEDELVLCFHEHNFIDCGVLIGETWCCDMDEYAIHGDNVIAWQPLPASYQKGE